MENALLKKVYATEDFKKRGHQLIDDLTNHIESAINEKTKKVIPWSLPTNELEYWRDFLKNGDEKLLFEETINRSTKIHHPKYIGHQVSPTAPIAILSSMISAALNNGTAVYEMGMVTNPIERIITDLICSKIGYDSNSNGFLTSGGTLANLTALLTARKAKISHDVWNEGHTKPLGILVSEEAHYCIERAAKIMGLGEQGIIKVPVKADFSMDTSVLESYYASAIAKGIEVFAIVGSAPSTATGILDDLNSIASFAKKYNLWFHADAAHGGAAIFSSKYKHTLKGIEYADSAVIDGHKMMMMPGITTALLYKDGRDSHTTFSQKADYLLEESVEEDWYNSGKRTFECTKNMMALHWFSLLKTYGEGVFDEFVTTLYDLGHVFAKIIKKDKQFELAVHPMTNIVCFRIVDSNLTEEETNELNVNIRQRLIEDGEFYIVQTKLRGKRYMRVTVMNPFTTEKHFFELIEKIKEIANGLIT